MVHILAVDDDNEVLETVGRVLRHEAYEVSLASSAAQALTFLDKRIPDLMILDILMPEMDGIQLCRQLRRDSRFIPLPILFLTAKGGTDDIVSGLDAGAESSAARSSDPENKPVGDVLLVLEFERDEADICLGESHGVSIQIRSGKRQSHRRATAGGVPDVGPDEWITQQRDRDEVVSSEGALGVAILTVGRGRVQGDENGKRDRGKLFSGAHTRASEGSCAGS